MYVCEIFESIQGETTQAGRPCAFVRFAGCDLRCRYCDTTYSFSDGTAMSRAEILQRLASFKTRFVTLTGGEPLLQKEIVPLCEDLLSAGWEVSMETHGQLPAGRLPPGVARIIDVKTPGSGHADEACVNLGELRPRDEVKFVIASRGDFDFSLEVIRRHALERAGEEWGGVPLLFSPVVGAVEPKDLVGWLLESGVRARLNLQLHKYVWSPETRGV